MLTTSQFYAFDDCTNKLQGLSSYSNNKWLYCPFLIMSILITFSGFNHLSFFYKLHIHWQYVCNAELDNLNSVLDFTSGQPRHASPLWNKAFMRLSSQYQLEMGLLIHIRQCAKKGLKSLSYLLHQQILESVCIQCIELNRFSPIFYTKKIKTFEM